MCEFRRGKHSKTFTIITDETIKEELRKHIRSLKYVERYPENVMRKLNNEWLSLIPRAPSKISETTAKRWMQYLNFRPEKSGKGYFVDGHERDDVVAHRKLFLEDFKNIEKRMFSWRGANMTEHDDLPAGVKRSVFITQDESLFYTNDAIKLTWEEKGGTQDGANKKIRPKSMGRAIHVSGFVCDCHGFMTSPSTGRKSYEIMKPGKNADGYWTNDDLCKQLEADAIPIAEELHPNCDLIWGFDNSQNHHARKPDALWAPNLPLKDNGKNAPKMRSTTWNGHVQSMQNAAGHQLGIKSILLARGMWYEGMRLECTSCGSGTPPDDLNCCARRVLGDCPDFAESKCWLEELLESRGHKLIFSPKFHCELNFIEMIWGYIKGILRRDCSFNFNDLVLNLPRHLDSVSLPFIKRASRHCLRFFMDGYRAGLVGPLLDYAMKKYKGHRMIPRDNLRLIEEEYKAKSVRR